uniref:Uncharacterized protein n=1 Tax=Glossina pallidipes TaxID=7398 RepID=A0A1A9ZFE3_GLOPL
MVDFKRNHLGQHSKPNLRREHAPWQTHNSLLSETPHYKHSMLLRRLTEAAEFGTSSFILVLVAVKGELQRLLFVQVLLLLLLLREWVLPPSPGRDLRKRNENERFSAK